MKGDVRGRNLTPFLVQPVTDHIGMLSGHSDIAVVVHDVLAADHPVLSKALALNFNGPSYDPVETELAQLPGAEGWFLSRKTVRERAFGVEATLILVGLYTGVIFLLAAAATLALQQLGETAGHSQRFLILRKLGASSEGMTGALFNQLALYFLLPAGLAIIRGTVALIALNRLLVGVGWPPMVHSLSFTGVTFALVYGVYFLATFFSMSHMIHKSSRWSCFCGTVRCHP